MTHDGWVMWHHWSMYNGDLVPLSADHLASPGRVYYIRNDSDMAAALSGWIWA